MKQCPFCAEEIQDQAIKCRHCGEFLDKTPWYSRTAFIVLALATVGPLALPLIWLRPKTSLAWKIGLTLVISVASWFLIRVTLDSISTIMNLYQNI